MSRVVYLAGPITDLTYEEASNWRIHTAQLLRPFAITCLSPLRRGNPTCKILPREREAILPVIDRSEIIRDKFDVRRSDLVLMNLEGAKCVSVGSMVELGWADAFDKPVILVPPPSHMAHGFLEHIPLVVTSLDEAIRMVLHFFGV